MTRTLPEVTRPWRGPIHRTHTPRRSQDYQAYRSCLRWEFGFSCAFCLLHEADIAAAGGEGWGVMAVEHFVPRSQAPDLVNEYSNCFYICALCNGTRGDQANRAPNGSELLNPCDCDWSEHFAAADDQVRPVDEADGDAAYTCEAYDFNDPRKVRARRMRRLVIHQCREFLATVETVNEDLLLAHAVETVDTQAVEMAQSLAAMRRLATLELLRYQAIPDDRPTACLCGDTSRHRLPSVLDEQS
jgi:hypothetical protein